MMRDLGIRLSRIASILMWAALAGSIGFSQAGASANHVETIVRDIDLEDAESIIIEGINGVIEVTGEDGRDSIHLKVIKSVTADDEAEAKKIASLMEIGVTRIGGAIKIDTQYPKEYKVKKNIFSFILDRNSKMVMEMTLVVPKGKALSVSMATGEIRIAEMEAAVSASMASGSVEIRSVGGDVEVSQTTGDVDVSGVIGGTSVSMTSGSVECRNLSGPARVDMTTGMLDISLVRGDVDLEMEYGTVNVEDVGNLQFSGKSADAKFIDVHGSISATSASGRLNFRTSPEKDADYRITSSSGSISVRFLEIMPGGFHLVASTTSGNIEAILPIDITKVGRTHIVGRVREGKAKVFLETASGDITIEEPEE